MGRCQPRHNAGVNFMGGEAASLTNPEKGRSDKRKINMKTTLEMRQLVITNAPVHGPR